MNSRLSQKLLAPSTRAALLSGKLSGMFTRLRRRPLLALSALGSLVVTLWCALRTPATEIEEWNGPEKPGPQSLVRGIEAIEAMTPGDQLTGSSRFDGEWRLVIHVMSATAYLQAARASPAPRTKAELRKQADRFLFALLKPELRQFDSEAWGADVLSELTVPRKAHLAALGYINYPLALRIHLGNAPPPLAKFHEKLTRALMLRYEHFDGLVPTYPSEIYPPDNAVCRWFFSHSLPSSTSRSPQKRSEIPSPCRISAREKRSSLPASFLSGPSFSESQRTRLRHNVRGLFSQRRRLEVEQIPIPRRQAASYTKSTWDTDSCASFQIGA